MVIQSINGLYLHAAWSTSADGGADFSLTEFPEATYRGSYMDNSATEKTDPIAYTWQEIGAVGESTDDVLEAENAAAIAQAQAEEAQIQTIINNANLQASQSSTDDKTGNPNELIGTNQGTNNWTASAGLSISAVTDTIYNDNSDAVNYLHVECDTAGTNYLVYNADTLRSKLAELTEDNSFTLSFDMRMSNTVAVDIAVQDTDGTNIQMDFGTVDNTLVPTVEEPADDTWIFTHVTTDVISGISVSEQGLYFDLSNLTSGDTVDIANLKIEGGGLATPWRASLEEVAQIANQAYQVAGNTNQYFWHTETGSDTGAHITEKTKDEFLQDPTNGGGNLLARSNGVAIRNGLDEIAQFTLSPYGEALIGMNDINACTLRGNYDRNADEARSRWAVQMQNNLAALAVMTIQAYNNKAIFDISGTGSSISNNGEGDLNLYSTNFYLNHEKLTDYVIERGTSGNWKYIKWHSGRVEAEGYVTFSSLAFSQRGSLYRSGATAFTIPSGIFDTAPTEGHAWIQSGSASDYFGAVIGSLTPTGGNCMVWKATSGTGSNISVHMRLVYRG